MKGLVLLLGESFRMGGQHSRDRGNDDAYDEQMKACESHVDFMHGLVQRFKLESLQVYIGTYRTKFDEDLIGFYKTQLVGNLFLDDVIGLNNLFHKCITDIENIEQYDFILYLRIDLCLKERFKEVFNPLACLLYTSPSPRD